MAKRTARNLEAVKTSATRASRSQQQVFFFGGGVADRNRSMSSLLGVKGAGLAEMTSAGLPVPPGFTLSTEVCVLFEDCAGKLPQSVELEMERALKRFETLTGATRHRFDSSIDLVSIMSVHLHIVWQELDWRPLMLC